MFRKMERYDGHPVAAIRRRPYIAKAPNGGYLRRRDNGVRLAPIVLKNSVFVCAEAV